MATRDSRSRRTNEAALAASYDCRVIAGVHRAAFVAVATMGLLAAGCGSQRTHTHSVTHRVAKTLTSPATPATPAPLVNPNQPVPAPGPTGIPAGAGAVNLIRAWSDALRRGDVRSASQYFALPSVMINGTDAGGQALVITIVDLSQAVAANAVAAVRGATHLG